MSTIQLKFLPERFSVYQYDRDYKLTADIFDAPWYTISKTASELSLILPTEYNALADKPPNKTEDGWRMFQVDAQMDFGLVGILARIVTPLKDASIPVFVVSTYDTDYVMVKEDKLTEAIKVLNGQPNMVVKPENHPYYPTDLEINNYVPNTRSTLQLLITAGGIMTGLIAVCTLSARKSTTSVPRYTWFAICGAMHTLFEGYWLLYRDSIASQNSLFAEFWKEYAHGDSRYLAADELLLTLELITALVWGPLCILSAYYIRSGSRRQYLFQLVASLCHLFSCSLYYIMDLPEATHCDPNPIYFYVYFITFNAPWIIVPLMLVYQSYSEINSALLTTTTMPSKSTFKSQ